MDSITIENIFKQVNENALSLSVILDDNSTYKFTLKNGEVTGVVEAPIIFNTSVRARFSSFYNSAEQISDYEIESTEAGKNWKKDYIVGLVADLATSSNISSFKYEYDNLEDDAEITLDEGINLNDLFESAVQEANARVEAFNRIPVNGHPLNEIFFRIVDPSFAEHDNDVNSLIELADQAGVNLWMVLQKAGGFKWSEIYANIADDIEKHLIELVDGEGNTISDTHESADTQVEEIRQISDEDNSSDYSENTVDRISATENDMPSFDDNNVNEDTVNSISSDNGVTTTEEEVDAITEDNDEDTTTSSIEDEQDNNVNGDEVEVEDAQKNNLINTDEHNEVEVNDTADEPAVENADDNQPVKDNNTAPVVEEETPRFSVPELKVPDMPSPLAEHYAPQEEQHEEETPAHYEEQPTIIIPPVVEEPNDYQNQEPLKSAVDNDIQTFDNNVNVEENNTQSIQEYETGLKDDDTSQNTQSQMKDIFLKEANNTAERLEKINQIQESLHETIEVQRGRVADMRNVERQIGDLKSQTSRLEGMLDSMKFEIDSHTEAVEKAYKELARTEHEKIELQKQSEWFVKAQKVLTEAGLL